MKRTTALTLLLLALSITHSLSAADSTKRFAYVTNQGDGTISGFSVNSSTGVLTALAGSPFGVGVGPASMTANPSGEHLYVVDTQFIPGVEGSNCNSAAGNVEVHDVKRTTGALTLKQTVTLPGVCAASIAIDKGDKNLYVLLETTDQSEAIIAGYKVNHATGELSEIGTASLGAAVNPGQIVVDPSGKFVYASDENGVYLFRRNLTTGALGKRSQQWTDSSGALDIDNKALFVATTGFHETPFIVEFSVNKATGALKFLWSVNPSTLPAALDLTSNSKFLASSNPDEDDVSNYQVPPNGHFVAVPTSPFKAGSRPVALSFSDGFLYNVNFSSNNISGYALNSTSGKLTPVSKSPFAVGNAPMGVVVLPR